jgi:hypothetical protein
MQTEEETRAVALLARIVARKARTARRASRQAPAEGCARRLRLRVFRSAPRQIVA